MPLADAPLEVVTEMVGSRAKKVSSSVPVAVSLSAFLTVTLRMGWLPPGGDGTRKVMALVPRPLMMAMLAAVAVQS